MTSLPRTVRSRAAALSLPAFVALLAGAPSTRAEETPRDLTPAPKWKVGDVLTRTEDVTMTIADRVGGKGYSSKSSNVVTVVSATWLERCGETNEEGERIAYRAYVRTWSRKENQKEEKSLAGRFVEVKGQGAERAWTLEGEPTKLSPGAQQWLDSAFGPGVRDDPVRSLLPADPVAAGAEWKPEVAGVAGVVLGSADAVDLEKSVVRATLASAKGDEAVVTWTMDAPWRSMPISGNKPFTKGGVWRVTGEATVVSDARVGVAKEAWSMQVQGEGIVKPEKDGNGPLMYVVEITAKAARTRALGGDMPAEGEK
jgi:hypothetical protein